MKKILKAVSLFSALVLLVLSFNACQKDAAPGSGNGSQPVLVYLNDDPSYDFTKVLIDIRYVEVKIDSSHGHHHDHDGDHDGDDDHHGHDEYGQWDTLGVTPGMYDLLRLRNGVDTLLASGLVGHGRITKLRFTLGNNNEVWPDSTHGEPLTICDNHHYVYVKLNSNSIDTLPGGQSVIRIDFDVERSVRRWNGHYCLQPYLRSFCNSRTGSVEGKVKPAAAMTLIKVYNATDTAYALPWWNGEFKVRGLNEGTYSVLYDGRTPYQDTTINNIQVQRGHETMLPQVPLHQ